MRRLTQLAAVCLFFLCVAPAWAASRSVWEENLQVDISTGSKQVRTVRVDLADPAIEIRPVMAGGTVGQTESLADMAAGAGAMAAVNGTFFNAYTDNQPQGTVFIDGVCHHLTDGAAIGFAEGGGVLINRLKTEIKGGINGSRVWPNSWYAWSVNSPKTESEAIVIFTPSFGGGMSAAPNSLSVVVSSGVVTGIVSGSAQIPPDGYVIGFGPGSLGDAGRFKKGDRVEYIVNLGSGWEKVRHAISAGPLLLKGGQIVLDPAAEGMGDPKITTASGARSFIGTAGNLLVMGTTPAATTRELAEIAKAAGLTEAMNLDGGASSGLYLNGGYLTPPGRNLSNCLVVAPKPEPPLSITVNGGKVAGVSPYIVPPGVTMAPVRGLFEKIGASVSWEESSQTVTVKLKKTSVKLRVGSGYAEVNGLRTVISRPAEIKDGRTYIPLRFIAENLGATVGWDEPGNTVTVIM